MSKKFQKTIENFKCEHCGNLVEGNGFTNHCPKCLWAKHVDINPGDRGNLCQGMMEPVRVEKSKKGFDLIHKCLKCGEEKRNKVSKEDDFDALVEIGKNKEK